MSETKTCFTCEQIKSVTEFYQSSQRAGVKTKTAGYRQSRCKICQAKDRNKYRQRNKETINTEKLKLGCIDCGYKKHPCVLDFHHKDRTNKLFSMSSRKAGTAGLELLLKEIAKCEVLCSNCHRIRHHVEKENQWY